MNSLKENCRKQKELKYHKGWNGGHYSLDGEEYNFIDTPEGLAFISFEDPRELIYKVTHGSDDDMGHNYPWERTDPGVIDGDLKPRFLPLKDLLDDADVFIEFF